MTFSRISATLTGLAYLVLGVVSLTGSVPDEHWGTRGTLVDLLGLIGFAANIPALERLREAILLSLIGTAGVRVAQVGLLAMCVESVASLVHGGNIISIVFFLGLLLTLLGLLVVTLVGVRQASSRWVAPLPFVGLLVGILAGEHGGFLVPGVVWLVLGVTAVGAGADEFSHPRQSTGV